MAITKDNFIVVYQLGNLDSVDFAIYYATKHGMDTVSGDYSANSGSIGGIDWQVDGQLLGIELTDNSEILSSESVFNTQVFNPIQNALQNSTELTNRNIYGIKNDKLIMSKPSKEEIRALKGEVKITLDKF